MRRNFVVATGCAGLLAVVTPALSVAAPAGDDVSPAQQEALDLGIQVAPKESDAAALTARTNPNPYLANLPDITDANYFAWNKQMHEQAGRRADSAKLAANRRAAFGTTNGRGVNARGVLTPFVHDEEEPAGTKGSNDSHVNAEPIPGFGTAAARMPAVRILGELAAPVGAPRTRHHHRGPGLDPAGHPDRDRRRCDGDQLRAGRRSARPRRVRRRRHQRLRLLLRGRRGRRDADGRHRGQRHRHRHDPRRLGRRGHAAGRRRRQRDGCAELALLHSPRRPAPTT